MTNPGPRHSLRRPHRVAPLVTALVLTTALAACKHNIYPDVKPPMICETEAAIRSSVFFIGDAGAPKLPKLQPGVPDALVDPVLQSLQRTVAERVADVGAERTLVVFLGDNI